MVTILFWNIHKADAVLPHLACLAARHSIDVFLLAECPKDIAPALAALGPAFREVDNDGAKVRLLTRLEPARIPHRVTGRTGDLALWSLPAPRIGGEILLGGVHLPSKAGGLTAAGQADAARDLAEVLGKAEDVAGHRRAVLAGDFNMHPYDEGMTSAIGLHAFMTRSLAERPDRVYRGEPRRRLYNPMWGFFGDRTPGPAGTHRWESSLPHNTHWSILDQVLLRPALIPTLGDLSILAHDGTHSLVDGEGFPDAENYSDHLPVLFRLDL